MRPLYTFNVKPSLPLELEPLRKLASNLKWSWDHELMGIFRRMDEDLWEETGHNPLMMLGQIKQERFEEIAEDDSFLSQLKRAAQNPSPERARLKIICNYFTLGNPRPRHCGPSASFGISIMPGQKG